MGVVERIGMEGVGEGKGLREWRRDWGGGVGGRRIDWGGGVGLRKWGRSREREKKVVRGEIRGGGEGLGKE